MKNKLGVLYFSLHLHLKKKFGFKPIAKKDFYALLGRHFLIPKNLRVVVQIGRASCRERVLFEV